MQDPECGEVFINYELESLIILLWTQWGQFYGYVTELTSQEDQIARLCDPVFWLFLKYEHVPGCKVIDFHVSNELCCITL